MAEYDLCTRQQNNTPDQIILLGDSIFDNAPYVDPGESVTEHLQNLFDQSMNLALTANVDLLAIDGSVMSDIPSQIQKVQSEVNDAKPFVFLSCGGNDLLGYQSSGLFSIPINTVAEGLQLLHEVRESFRKGYRKMLDSVQLVFSSLVVCTIYDRVPHLSGAEQTALSLFNEVILREATLRQLEVIDLRTICDQPEDYAPCSPIEPSTYGAQKIAQAIFNQYASYKSNEQETLLCR